MDHQGVVKLADFGASKRIENLVTLNSGFKSLKGTPNWMAPEVIKQTGTHNKPHFLRGIKVMEDKLISGQWDVLL